MYIPEAHRERRPEQIHQLIRQNSFGTLVTCREGELVATHLPFLLDASAGPHGTLFGHMARANDQWRQLQDCGEAMAIFQGPHAYISPSWYEAELAVPTWNYVAVHAYGSPALVEDDASLHRMLAEFVTIYEAGFPKPWPFQLPAEFTERMLRGIVGFRIEITRLEGKLKMSQNRSAADQQSVVTALQQSGDPMDAAVAEVMRRQAGEG